MQRLACATASICLLAIAGQACATRPYVQPPDAELFRKGYEAYLEGKVAVGVRTMEQAEAQGSRGAHFRLCVIYAKPSRAQGGDPAKLKARCPPVAPDAASAGSVSDR